MRLISTSLNFLMILTFVWALPIQAEVNCNLLLHDQQQLLKMHSEKSFNTTRDLDGTVARTGAYSYNLGKSFLEDLSMLSGTQHWLDSGGGEGVAVKSYLASKRSQKKAQVSLLSYVTELKSGDGLKVLSGRLIEEIPINEMGKVDLLTDVYGPFAYSSKPAQVLSIYHQLLKVGGVAYLAAYDEEMLKSSGWMDAEGNRHSLLEMIHSIPGLEVSVTETQPTTSVIRLVKRSEESWTPPELKLIFHDRGQPPVRIWVDQNWNDVAAEKARSRAVLKNEQKRIKNASQYSNQIEPSLLRPMNIRSTLQWPTRTQKSLDTLPSDRSLDLVTDLSFGAITTDLMPDVVLKKYLEAINDQGSILIPAFMSIRIVVMREKGVLENLSIQQWIAKIPGIKLIDHSDQTALIQIQIQDRKQILVPELLFVTELPGNNSFPLPGVYLQK